MSGNRDSRERGVGLLVTLIALSMLTVLGLGLTTTGRISFMISSNQEDAIEAGYIAEAGLNHARELVIDLNTTDYTSLLTAGDGTACNGDELSAVATDPIASAGRAFGNGQYTVSICDDDGDGDGDTNADSNSLVRIVSVGTGSDNATATMEMTLGTEDLPGFLVDGNLRINGNPTINGAGGSLHSNGNLQLVGNPCAQLHFGTANLVDSNGDPVDPSTLGADTGASCNESGASADIRDSEAGVSVPTVDFNALYAAVDYRLENDGTITEVATGLDVSGTLTEWNWDSGNVKWTLSGNTMTDGSYYAVESNINISGNPGGNINPADVTLVADGFIDISGNPDFVPSLTLNGVAYSLVAGTDMGLSGNVGTSGQQGFHYAHHQIKFNGNSHIYGQVIVADAADIPIWGSSNLAELDGDGYMGVSGNVTITYEGGGGFGGLLVSGWREVRN